MLDRGPVILAQRSRAAAVLVSAAQWDQLIRRVAEAEGANESRRIYEATKRGTRGKTSLDDLKRMIWSYAFSTIDSPLLG